MTHFNTRILDKDVSRFVLLECVTSNIRLVFYGSEGVQSIGCAWTPKHMLFGNFLSVLSALKANVEKENHIKKT